MKGIISELAISSYILNPINLISIFNYPVSNIIITKLLKLERILSLIAQTLPDNLQQQHDQIL